MLVVFLCRSRKGEVSDEIFDMLLSFTDFLTFKQAMLDYKAVSKLVLNDVIMMSYPRPLAGEGGQSN